MVRKTSHRGVHSGNTLRAFNSRYSRRYHNQACIVCRVRPELLQKLKLDGGADDLPGRNGADDRKPPREPLHNSAVDVALSLNKQSRWLLPAALIRQIQTDNIADPELRVSVLERHKLKRPVNCVSFHSNSEKARKGHYFGFRFPAADGKSRRSARRELREQMEKVGLGKKTNNGKKPVGKIVQVFTEQGKDREIGESEVQYEVYYPCPANSSISHNPKYIMQDVDSQNHVQHGKPRKQHRGRRRKRIAPRDIDDWELTSDPSHQPSETLTTIVDQDVASEDSQNHVQHGKPRKQHRGKRRKRIALRDIDDWELTSDPSHQPSKTLTTIVDQEETSSLFHSKDERNPTECLLTSLIEKAQRLQNFKGIAKLHRKKNKASVHQEHDKSHIVFLSETQEHSDQGEESEESPAPPLPPVSPIPSESTRVLLPKDDVTMVNLKDCFGEAYTEVACKPRKFVLDITSSVRNLLKKQGIQAKVAEKTEEALSYLICVHDGFYNDEYDVFRVLLNSKLHEGLVAVKINTQEQQDLFRGTVMNLISQTMNFMQGLVMTLKEKKYFPLFIDDQTAKVSPRHLSNHLGSSESYVPSVKRVTQMGSSISNNTVAVPSMSDLLEGSGFCDVCYDDISPLIHDSAPSTSLLTCEHHVCDSCWSQHIHTRLHEGFVRLTCPGYECQEDVKVGALLSMAPLNTVEKLLLRQEEVRIGASQTEKWCPNEFCGRVISLQPSPSGGELQFRQDIVCACGTHVCFQCLMPAHWPASCKQTDDYRASLATAIFPDRLAEVHDDFKVEEQAKLNRELEKKIMLVEGKHCPTCSSFVFKNGGCPQMTCRCGQIFCWFCASPGYAHHDRTCVSEKKEKELTTTVVVHHLEYDKHPDGTKKQQPSSSGHRRQRMSLRERAMEHRQDREKKQLSNSYAVASLAKAVTPATLKNKIITQHITRACFGAGAFPSSSAESKQGSATDTSRRTSNSSVFEMVSDFLKNAAQSRQELLEMVEYSLVLLKDLPDSLLRRRAIRISEDLGAFCSFSQSIFDVWGNGESSQAAQQEAVKAVMRLAEIQGWIHAALDTHLVTFRRLRGLHLHEL